MKKSLDEYIPLDIRDGCEPKGEDWSVLDNNFLNWEVSDEEIEHE